MKRTNIDIMKALDGLNLNAKYKNVLFDVLNSANDNSNDEDTELINKYAYGIRWDDTKPGSACERIGNLDLHRSLPIQSKLSICIHKGQEIHCYTERDDARFANEREKTYITIDKAKLIDGGQCISIECENAKYRYCWVRIKVDGYTYVGRIIPYESLEGDVTLNKIWCAELMNHPNIIIEDAEKFILNIEIEFGIPFNGYCGEIGVDTGDRWYLWSKEYGDIHEVWMSTIKCVPYAREIPRFIISRNKPLILNESIKDRDDAEMWGWLGKMDKDVPLDIVNYMSFARGDGQYNDDELKHKYFTYNIFNFDKSNDCVTTYNSLNKPKNLENANETYMSNLLETTEQININDGVLDCRRIYSKRLWEALIWMYIVEYADFNPNKDFIEELTPEGFHQGGLGKGYGLVGGADALLEYGSKSAFTQVGPRNKDTNVWANATSYFKLNVTGSFTNDSLIINKTLDDIADPVVSISSKWLAGVIKIRIQGLVDNTLRIKVDDKDIISITEDGYYDVDFGINVDSSNTYNNFIYLDKPIIDGNLIISLGDVKSVILNTNFNVYMNQYRGIVDFADKMCTITLGDYRIHSALKIYDYRYRPIPLDEDNKPYFPKNDVNIYNTTLSFNDNPKNILTDDTEHSGLKYHNISNIKEDSNLNNITISTLNDGSILPIYKTNDVKHDTIAFNYLVGEQYTYNICTDNNYGKFKIFNKVNKWYNYRIVTIFDDIDSINTANQIISQTTN